MGLTYPCKSRNYLSGQTNEGNFSNSHPTFCHSWRKESATTPYHCQNFYNAERHAFSSLASGRSVRSFANYILKFLSMREMFNFPVIMKMSWHGNTLWGQSTAWWCHQMETHFPRYGPFVRGIHRSPVNSPHKGQWHVALVFSLICIWTNSWVNNWDVGDLRHHHTHYDVIVMGH